jgi:hypothetical protein
MMKVVSFSMEINEFEEMKVIGQTYYCNCWPSECR